MNPRFLLPCECGESVAIQTSQAGQTVRCSCGRTLTAPSMRGIRQLKPAPDASAQPRARSSWSLTKGVMFSLGLLMAITGLGMTAYNYPIYSNYSIAANTGPSEEQIQDFRDRVDASTPSDMLDIWHDLSAHGIGEHENSPYVFYRRIARRFRNIVGVGIALTVIGTILVVSPFVMRGK